MKFVNPRNDVAFKKIFGNEEHQEILISFLNAVLDLTGDKEIQEIEWLSPLQTPRIKPFRDTLIDVRVTDKRGISFLVESKLERKAGIQAYFPGMSFRKGEGCCTRPENFPKQDSVIFIGILDFKEFATEHYLTRIQALHTPTDQQDMQDVEFNFIELPKFTKQQEEVETILDKWLFFLTHADALTRIPDNADTRVLRAAYDIINQGEWSREELEVYEYWGIKGQDERGAVQYALRTGIQQGEMRKAVDTASKMLADGLAPEMIMKYTGLTPEELASLAQEER